MRRLHGPFNYILLQMFCNNNKSCADFLCRVHAGYLARNRLALSIFFKFVLAKKNLILAVELEDAYFKSWIFGD